MRCSYHGPSVTIGRIAGQIAANKAALSYFPPLRSKQNLFFKKGASLARSELSGMRLIATDRWCIY
jgi:hypothetical protein